MLATFHLLAWAHRGSLKKGTAMKQLTMAFLRLSVRTLIFFHLDWPF